MFHGDEPVDIETETAKKLEAIQNVAQYRDQVFEDSGWRTLKAVGGIVLGMYFVYRFLLK